MRYKVPQDVQQADRIVGPLTAIQLVECVIGTAVAYFFYTNVGTPVNIMLAILVAGVTVVFVFVRLHEMSFAQYIASMSLFLFRPRVRTWKKLSDTIVPPLPQAQSAAQLAATAATEAAKAEVTPAPSIRDLTKLLDTHRMHEEEDELPLEIDSARSRTLASISELDERLRARQGRAAVKTPAHE